ncbi:hypothetical protein OIU85_002958 [Salix viminalis]|uniref:Uncharacterized protein n=1 Tax=Salix viminalis TaxID=40686 RepID=A0A9Q0PYQ9_SALVM|nr:hypothetical protein OIU85_002958 [Salix viminalis]
MLTHSPNTVSVQTKVNSTEHVFATKKLIQNQQQHPSSRIRGQRIVRIIHTDPDATDSSSDEEEEQDQEGSLSRERRHEVIDDHGESCESPFNVLTSPTSVLRYEEWTLFDSLAYGDVDAFGFKIDVPSGLPDLKLPVEFVDLDDFLVEAIC